MRKLIVVLCVTACGGVPGAGGTGGGFPGGSGGAGGADSGPSIDREALSGSRLKNRYIEGDDGSRTPLGFYDTARGEVCGFQFGEDGRWRCLPLEGALFYTPVEYADPGCTQPVAYDPQACGDAKYAYRATGTCPALYMMYRATAFTPTQLYVRPNMACVAEAPASSGRYYRLDPVLATEFAAGTDKHD